jgi:hypothetical protein
LEKQNTTKSLSSRRREYVSGAADRTPAAQNITSLFLRPRTLSVDRYMMRPFALEIAAGDFPFAAGHRRIAISLLAGTLNSAAAFSMVVASSGCLELAEPDGFAGDLVDVPADRLRWFGLLCHVESIDHKVNTFNPAKGTLPGFVP